jgi:hypothetical protein
MWLCSCCRCALLAPSYPHSSFKTMLRPPLLCDPHSTRQAFITHSFSLGLYWGAQGLVQVTAVGAWRVKEGLVTQQVQLWLVPVGPCLVQHGPNFLPVLSHCYQPTSVRQWLPKGLPYWTTWLLAAKKWPWLAQHNEDPYVTFHLRTAVSSSSSRTVKLQESPPPYKTQKMLLSCWLCALPHLC